MLGTSVSYLNSYFKFQNVLKHAESWNSLTCNQNIKEDISTALEVFICFEAKRNDIKQIVHENTHATREEYPRKNWVIYLKIA